MNVARCTCICVPTCASASGSFSAVACPEDPYAQISPLVFIITIITIIIIMIIIIIVSSSSSSMFLCYCCFLCVICVAFVCLSYLFISPWRLPLLSCVYLLSFCLVILISYYWVLSRVGPLRACCATPTRPGGAPPAAGPSTDTTSRTVFCWV